MAVRNINSVHHDSRPRKLRFGHLTAGGHVAFAADSVPGQGTASGVLSGHAREHAFAVLVYLRHWEPMVTVEVDGAKIFGRFDQIDDERARVSFIPQTRTGHAIPMPTRHVCWVHWKLGEDAYLAECTVQGSSAEECWWIGAPSAVESEDRRLLPRFPVNSQWRFEGGRTHSAPFDAPRTLVNLSIVGCALIVPGEWRAEEFTGERMTGVLHVPGDHEINTQLVVRHAYPVQGGTLLGASFMGMGMYGVRRLGRFIAER